MQELNDETNGMWDCAAKCSGPCFGLCYATVATGMVGSAIGTGSFYYGSLTSDK